MREACLGVEWPKMYKEDDEWRSLVGIS
jgi:hypothetical protein